MNTYKIQVWLIGINVVLFITVILGLVFAPILGFCQIAFNLINLIQKRRVKQRLCYFAGIVLYFSVISMDVSFYISGVGEVFTFLGFVLPFAFAFYSLYLAKLDNDEDDGKGELPQVALLETIDNR